MTYSAWILYSLFSLNVDGQAYVVQGHMFKTSQECVTYGKTYIKRLGETMTNDLTNRYGSGNYIPLEIGCVPKNSEGVDDPSKRIPLVRMPREMYPKIEDQGVML